MYKKTFILGCFSPHFVDRAASWVKTETRKITGRAESLTISNYPYNALEEAIRIKEKLGEAEIYTVTVSS